VPKVVFLDTTVKSGGDFAKRFLAPSWDMLSKYRSGGGEIEYTLAYLKKLHDNKETIVNMFTGFINKYGLRELILGCYCRSDKFCHRHLLSRFLLENIPNIEKGGELTSQSFEMVEGFNPVILSYGEFAEIPDDEIAQLIGCEYTLVPDETLSDEERVKKAISDAYKAIARCDGPILDKTGLLLKCDTLDIPVVEVTMPEEVRSQFFKLWPLPSPEKPDQRFTEWMGTLYQECLPK